MTEFALGPREADAVAIAYDELVAYWETIGQESSLDDEEMPSEKIPWAIDTLKALLDRYARYEHLTTQAGKHGGTVGVPPVRLTYRPDTPPSGPEPC